MPTVYLSSPENSTFFTTCCNVAIQPEQRNCPGCGEEVTPHGNRARWAAAFKPEPERRYRMTPRGARR